MARRNDIDPILGGWPYRPGEIVARLVRARDGRQVVQMRLEMGILQMETEGRPDGERPGGLETYFDYLLSLERDNGEQLVLDPEQCNEADREFVQFYHRRVCWLALREFEKAARDADHTLAFMDFVRDRAPSDEWMLSHEQYRPFVLFHRAQAAALARLEHDGPEAAIAEVNQGLNRFKVLYGDMAEDNFAEDELVVRLEELKESIRDHYQVGRTLPEQLADAVAAEDYERAARLRDEIARKHQGGGSI